MAPIRARLALIGALTLGWLALVAPAAAVHQGKTADCGSAGSFTIRAQPNSAGFQAPDPTAVLLFEEGGVLTIQKIVRNGVVVFEPAVVGVGNNAVDEVTCTFTLSGVVFVVTGVLAG